MTMDQPTLSMPVPEMIQIAYQELRNAKPDTASAAFIGVLEQIPGFNLAQGVREKISETVEILRMGDAASRNVLQLAKATFLNDAHLSSLIGAVLLTPSGRADKFKVEIGISYPISLSMARQGMSVAFHVENGVLTYGYLDVRNLQKGFTFEPNGVAHVITKVDKERSNNIFFSPELVDKQFLLPRVIHAFTTRGTLPDLNAPDFRQRMEKIILAQ